MITTMKSGQQLHKLLIIIILALTSSLIEAAPAVTNEHVQFNGFATLGLTNSGNELLGYRRDQVSNSVFDGDWSLAADSMIGVQMDFKANDRFGGGLQLVGKDRSVNSLDNSIPWAFLRYRFNPDWTLRAGRLAFDLFMLSEYLDVGFAYLWAHPPLEFYTLGTFDSYEGAELSWSTLMGAGTLRAKMFVGSSKTNTSTQGNLIDIELNDIIGGTLTWESQKWQLRISASDNQLGEKGDYFLGTEPLANYLQMATPIWPEAAGIVDRLTVTNPHIRYLALGAAYTLNPWKIQSEVGYFDSKIPLYSSQLNSYLSLGYQLRSVTPYVMIANAQSLDSRTIAPQAPVLPGLTEVNTQLAQLQQATQDVYDGIRVDQSTVSAGLRWDLRYDLALKVQWDHSWIGARAAALWDIRAIPEQDQEIDTFSINLNCIF